MKRNVFLATIVFVAMMCAICFAISSNKSKKQSRNFMLDNIEALTTEEDPTTLHCTKVDRTASCYRKIEMWINGKKVVTEQWVGFIVKSVTEYTVSVGSPIECTHAAVTHCSYGSYEKNQ